MGVLKTLAAPVLIAMTVVLILLGGALLAANGAYDPATPVPVILVAVGLLVVWYAVFIAWWNVRGLK